MASKTLKILLPIAVLAAGATATAALISSRKAPERQERPPLGPLVETQTVEASDVLVEVTGQGDLLPRAKELALLLGSRAPLAFAAGRDAVLRSTETDLLTGIDFERKLYAMLMATEDRDEGLAAYREKRLPNYKGR